MASIKIHRDVFNFERRRAGFTHRQITSIAAAVIVALVLAALLGYALEVPWSVAVTVAILPAFPIAAAGFLPIFGLPAEEFIARLIALSERGQVITCAAEALDAPEGGVSRVYEKARKKRGCECAERI